MKTYPHLTLAPHKTPVILVVDDDPEARQFLKQLIEQDGFQAIEASNGTQAIKLYLNHHPDLVLLDILMPVMDGYDFCRQVQTFPYYPVPVMVISKLDSDEAIHQAFEAGAIDFVTKPIHPMILRQRVQQLIEKSHLKQQIQQLNQSLAQDFQDLNVSGYEWAMQLQRSLQFETLLKQISDQLRNSVDASQILPAIVKELAITLDLHRCNIGIYNWERRTSTVQYEYAECGSCYQDRTLQLDDYPEIYDSLRQGNSVHCSPVHPYTNGEQVAMFAFPIQQKETIGDLWLVTSADRILDDLEIRLVKQVANQVAIAVRQAQLHQQCQAQAQEIVQIKQLKDDFLSTISHELRTPITSMKVAIQLLEHSLQTATDLAEATPSLDNQLTKSTTYLKILHSECDKEIDLINDLLNLQRLQVGAYSLNLVLLPLQEWLFEEIDAFTLCAHNRGQAFQLNLFPPLLSLEIDPVHLRRILTELVNNACKYSPPEAMITLSVASEWQEEENSKAPFAPGDRVIISVTNTGVEISQPNLERVFDKFYRIPKSDRWNQGGTGLGLALVKSLVDLYGGSIQVTSGNNQTCFTITLQVNQQQCNL